MESEARYRWARDNVAVDAHSGEQGTSDHKRTR